MKKHGLIGLCAVLSLAFAACHNTPQTPENPNQQTEQVDSARDPLSLLNDSIAQDENRADLYLRRASLYVDREQVGQAMMDVNKAIQLDPQNAAAPVLGP